jgi:hypothetical protein
VFILADEMLVLKEVKIGIVTVAAALGTEPKNTELSETGTMGYRVSTTPLVVVVHGGW